ncbi:hypothetical protein PR202_ga07036 [Eleusine coracana subsp. coracana]|uniref:Glycosyl transferase 48 domain-containing protein n=1 Tax=Eleusine coracana subsp. coracana TaxID=191504 RepID=A0AAV5BYW0_ELECO|nr:hypothetical protein PR202_ga07036 [Eleusine coracana subsp. coracana]
MREKPDGKPCPLDKLGDKQPAMLLNRGGWVRQILLRPVPFGIFSEALTGCGQSLCLGFRLGSSNINVLIIMAWHGLESPLQLLDPIIFEDVLSIFITNAVLRVIQVILDIAFSWRTKRTMKFNHMLRFSVKLSLAVAWAIILPIFYVSSKKYKACSAGRSKAFLGMFCLSKYMVVVALYLASNVIGMALFFVPAVTSYIETSTWRVCNILSWWCQVFFMDTQIWYSVFCTIFGGMCGIIHHLGEIRTMGMVRSRFCTLPEAFNASLVPCSLPKEGKGILPSFLEKKIFNKKLGKAESHDPTKFALIWNQIVKSFRSEDLISNRFALITLLQLKLYQFMNKQELRHEVTILLQDIVDILIQDMIVDAQRILDVINSSERLISNDDGAFEYYEPELFASGIGKDYSADKTILCIQVKRLYFLLNTKEKVVEIPSNLEARRRISFFATSLFMDMPAAPKVRNMLSFSIITPYFLEEVKFSDEELHSDQDEASILELHSNQDEASILSYMQKIYPDEWKNFLERLGPKLTNEDIRYWASFRGQTLSRTVRGMMYYRRALRLQAFLDRTNDQELYKGPIVTERGQNKSNTHQSLSTELDALADMKFSYVISCQKFGEQKIKGDPHAQDIIDLMTRYPALRVAYIEEKEVIVNNRTQKVYSSILIKGENNFDQEVYRIKLPGPPIIGEGKPENQNHAIIFTRGEALQTIDMNQDNYLEEAYKMRNVLQEFVRHPKGQAPTILGLREHIFTGSVSSLAGFMSYQETSFVTIGQRFLADPLR